MSFAHLLYDISEGVARITLNRPAALNALNLALIGELSAALDKVNGDPAVRVVVITGAGEKAFVAGADIGEMAAFDSMQGRDFGAAGQEVMAKIGLLPMPVLAAVNGFALGGGCELALACDFVYAADTAVFGLPEVTLGLIPGFGGTQRLARRVGEAMAMEMIFTGSRLTAEEARRVGIANRVIAADLLMEETMKTARKIAGMGPAALTLAKGAVRKGAGVDLVSGCHMEKEAFGLCFATADMKEGTAAFLEKRKPAFSKTR